MKATLFAVPLSLFVVCSSAYVGMVNAQSHTPLTEQKIRKINLNKADVSTLAKSCKGIGKKRAEAIVSYREMHGGFRSINELAQVRGIGKQFVKRHMAQLQNVFTIN